MLWTYGDYDGLTLPGPTVEPMPHVTLQTPPYTITRPHTYTGPGNYFVNVTIFNLATRQEIVEPVSLGMKHTIEYVKMGAFVNTLEQQFISV